MKRKILFLQLPLLDNDAATQRENYPFAGLWLAHALAGHAESRFWRVDFAPAMWDELDNAHLLEQVLDSGVTAVAFTLYLWNVERSLRLARALRERCPGILLLAGGPEVAANHPFLLNGHSFDALVIGEGEVLFPEILQGFRTGDMPAFTKVLLATPTGWKRGHQSVPPADLAAAQVPVRLLRACIATRPSVYLETARGCPMACTYCRYRQEQQGRVRVLTADATLRRLRQLRAAGAREIRFVDPTFNGRADFGRLVRRLAAANRDRTLMFFAELRADRLTPEQARWLARANFVEVEVGVQSIDPQVLRTIRRPANIAHVEQGIRLMTAAGIRVTVDLMYGLPGQTYDDVVNGIAWARGLGPNVTVQCMQTLLLPGTELREQAARHGIQALPIPPYGVYATATMTREEMARIEALLQDSTDLAADPVTPRFSGYRLAGLFREQCTLDVRRLGDADQQVPGRQNRRALLIRGRDLHRHASAIQRLIVRAVAHEPDVLWQFVLCPEGEEPLDFLDAVIDTLLSQPPHLIDRYASASLFGSLASRRLYVRLKQGGRYSAGWREQVEDLLERYFI